MVDVRGDVLRPPHGTTPAAVKAVKAVKAATLAITEILVPGQARDCSVTVLESRIGTEDRRKRQAICSWTDRAGENAEVASTVAGQ